MFYEPEDDGESRAPEHSHFRQHAALHHNTDDGEESGIVFQRESESINIFDEDAWDDSALLKAFCQI